MTKQKPDFWVISQAIFAFSAVFFGIFIPLQIEGSQRKLQNQSNCTNAILTLRRDLANFYDLGDDGNGNVLDDAGSNASPEEQARMLNVRRTAQNSRDTVYVLCRELGSGISVNAEDKPWVDSPADITDSWSRKNISDILRQSSMTIDQIARIKPTPFKDWSQLFG